MFISPPICRHQAGWFPFNLENELQLPGDRANQDDMEGELQNHDLQEMVTVSLIDFSFTKIIHIDFISVVGCNLLLSILDIK